MSRVDSREQINVSSAKCIVRWSCRAVVDERRLLVKNTHRETERQRNERAEKEEDKERRGCNIDESCGRRQKAKQSISSQSVSCRSNQPTDRPTDRCNDN